MRRSTVYLGVILGVLFVAHLWRVRAIESENFALRNALAAADTLTEVRAGLYRRAAQEARSVKELMKEISLRGEALKKEVENLNARPVSVTTVTVQAPPETLYAEVVQPSALGVREYRFDFDMATVSVSMDSMLSATATIRPKPLTLNVVIARHNEHFSALVTTNPAIPVTAVNTTVLTDTGWFTRNRRWLYAGAGASAVGWVLTGKIGYALPAGFLVVMEALHR